MTQDTESLVIERRGENYREVHGGFKDNDDVLFLTLGTGYMEIHCMTNLYL